MEKLTKISVRKHRSVHTYSEIWHASNCVLQVGLDDEKGSTWQFLSSIVLTAFAFEAYLNHIGPRTLHGWGTIERSPVWSKFLLLAEVLGAKFPDKAQRRQVQGVLALFEFRNSIAHGHSEELHTNETTIYRPDLDPFATSPCAKWEEQIKHPKYAQAVLEDVEAVLRILHAARIDEKEQLFSFGMGHLSASILVPGIPVLPHE